MPKIDEVMCKNCRAYRPYLETEIELSGQLEAVEKPYGSCVILEDQVEENEWCGAFTERKNELQGVS